MDPAYNTVAERIVEFRVKYPEGSLQPLNLDKPYELVTVNGNPMFIVVAAAYRTPDDPRPGVGMAYEPIPGSTPFTKGSELQNCETAAWGRALIAVLAADTKKGVASFEEVLFAQEREKQDRRAAAGASQTAQSVHPVPTPRPSAPVAQEAGQAVAERVLGAEMESVMPNAQSPVQSSAMQRAWLQDIVSGMNDETRERYLVLWHEAKLPALAKLSVDEFNTAVSILPPKPAESEYMEEGA